MLAMHHVGVTLSELKIIFNEPWNDEIMCYLYVTLVL